MKCKDYLFKMHHGLVITDDDEELLEELREIGGTKIKVRADDRYTVTRSEYKSFEKTIGESLDLGVVQQNATSLRGPQGHRNTWDGCQFDSVWEYAFYRYHKELTGSVIIRNETEWIPYADENGKQRRFYFDFLLDSLPYEVKGIFRPSDMAKMQATSGQVTFVSKNEILPIIKELDDRIPTWRNDCIFN